MSTLKIADFGELSNLARRQIAVTGCGELLRKIKQDRFNSIKHKRRKLSTFAPRYYEAVEDCVLAIVGAQIIASKTGEPCGFEIGRLGRNVYTNVEKSTFLNVPAVAGLIRIVRPSLEGNQTTGYVQIAAILWLANLFERLGVHPVNFEEPALPAESL